MTTQLTEPKAIAAVLAFLNNLMRKDQHAFEASFHPDPEVPLVDVLPGGKKIKSAAHLISLHPAFFKHPDTRFEPLIPADSFQEEHLEYQLDSKSFFQTGVDLRVVKNVVLSDSDNSTKLEEIKNHLSLTFLYDEKINKWFPQLITNTIIE